MDIEIKTPEQIAVMREAGLVVARTLRVLAAAVRPGITTAELDALAEAEIRAAGATPSFKGYHGYPATICTSVNEEIVHGIPSPDIRLAAGDYDFAVAWIRDPLNAVLVALTIAISFWHMHAGMRVVIEDYIHVALSKAGLTLLSLFVCGLSGALAIFSILKVALGGGAY